MKERVIAIGGGVGPMAGVELHKKIIENTPPVSGDKEHFPVYHVSRSPAIEDRTLFLLGKSEKNPADEMYNSFKAIALGVRAVDHMNIVAGVPCNTFHAKRILDRFLGLLEAEPDIQFVNMIEETGKSIRESYPQAKRIGLMSTTGTREVGVYKEILAPHYEIVEVPEDVQPTLHDSIYNQQWGIKAQSSPVSQQARNNFLQYVEMLKEQQVDAIILGCTEIPLALPEKEINDIPLVDPVLVLAKALVREASPQEIKPTT